MATDPFDLDEQPPALGVVLDEDRGSLPYSLIHGEALVACAAWALGDAGVTPLDVGVPWEDVRAAGEPLVLHDSLCPMTPAHFIATCVRRAVDDDAIVVAVRPMTDPVRPGAGGPVRDPGTREGPMSPASPVVLPASVVALLETAPGSDLVAVVADLRSRFPMALVEAPAAARRVESVEDVRVLEAETGSSGPT